MKKKAMSIRTRMMISYLSVLLIPSIIIAAVTYSAASGRVEQDLMGSARESVAVADRIVTNEIEGKLKDLDYFGKLITAEHVNEEIAFGGNQIKRQLQEYQATNNNVLNFYIGTSKGKILLAKDEKLGEDFDPRTRDWYVIALKSQKAAVSPSYLSVDGNPVVSISQKLADGNGVISMDLDLSAVATLTDIDVGNEGYIFIVDISKKLLVHPTAKIGEEYKEDFVNRMFQADAGTFDYESDGQNYKMAFLINETTGWRIGGTMSQDEVADATEGIRNIALIVVLASVLGAAVIVYLNVRSVVRPLRKLNEATAILGQGDLTQRLDSFRQDEIGALAGNFQVMVDNLRSMIEGVKEMTDNVSVSAEQLSTGAEQTTKAIEHVTVAISEVAVGSEGQLRSVETGTQSVANMRRKVDSVSERMREVAGAMGKTSDSASQGTLAVASTEERIREIRDTVEELGGIVLSLNERAEHIGDIIGVISGIAKQTNMLALNASIEAAKAGEQGRGFAVVASEVRKLAEGTQGSADQIKDLIAYIQGEVRQAAATMEEVKGRVRDGMEAMDRSGESFGLIRESVFGAAEIVTAVSEMMGEVASEASEVERAIGYIRTLSGETAGNTETISAAAEEQLASLQEMASSSADLSSMAEQLQQMVGRFKTY